MANDLSSTSERERQSRPVSTGVAVGVGVVVSLILAWFVLGPDEAEFNAASQDVAAESIQDVADTATGVPPTATVTPVNLLSTADPITTGNVGLARVVTQGDDDERAAPIEPIAPTATATATVIPSPTPTNTPTATSTPERDIERVWAPSAPGALNLRRDEPDEPNQVLIPVNTGSSDAGRDDDPAPIRNSPAVEREAPAAPAPDPPPPVVPAAEEPPEPDLPPAEPDWEPVDEPGELELPTIEEPVIPELPDIQEPVIPEFPDIEEPDEPDRPFGDDNEDDADD